MPSIPLDLHLPGSGSTTEKQERACKVALVVAAVKGPLPSGGTRPGDGSRSIRSLIHQKSDLSDIRSHNQGGTVQRVAFSECALCEYHRSFGITTK